MVALNDVIKTDDSTRTQSLKIEKVKIDSATNAIVVVLCAAHQPSDKELSVISQRLSEKLGSDNIVFEINTADELSNKFDPSKLNEYISRYKAELLKKGMGICANSLLSYTFKQPDKIIFEIFSPLNLQILTEKSIKKNCEEWFLSHTGTEISVSFELDSRSKEKIVAEQLAISEKKMEKARNNVSPASSHEKKKTIQDISSDKPVFGKPFSLAPIAMNAVTEGAGYVVVEGEIFEVDIHELKTGNYIISFNFTDKTSSLTAKIFANKSEIDVLSAEIKKGAYIRARGELRFDSYAKQDCFRVFSFYKATKATRQDTSDEKRVELHAHTMMSESDAFVEPGDLVKRAHSWGHKAIAITDHGVLQGNPDAFDQVARFGKEDPFKAIFGCEGYLTDEENTVTTAINGKFLLDFTALDIETTGLSSVNDTIIELGAVKFRNGKAVEFYDTLIDPGIFIPYEITQTTGITNKMTEGHPKIGEKIGDFISFLGDDILVGHNIEFDLGFIKRAARNAGIQLKNNYIDTLILSRVLLANEIKKYSLDKVAAYLKVDQIEHHRAQDDALVSGNILLKLYEFASKNGITTFDELNRSAIDSSAKGVQSYHITVLAKNITGMTNLNRIVSDAHLNHFNHLRPHMLKEMIATYREGLLIGTACDGGQLYKAIVRGLPQETIEEIASFYDYIEIQPRSNCMHLVRDGQVADEDELIRINKYLVSLAKKLNKPFVATGDVHFMDPEDSIYRSTMMDSKGYSDADIQPELYFKTTDEMLREFAYLGEEDCYNAVIRYPNYIADQIEKFKIMPDELVAPKIDEAEQIIQKMSYDNAHLKYGEELHPIIEQRMKRELDSIIGNKYAVLYYSAVKLVKKSNEDGYIVGSRGSVGASLIANLVGITEVNPLIPHYRCVKCHKPFFDHGHTDCTSAPDLPEMNCPICGEPLLREGYGIPFEVFLGFHGEKVPDIDLNFSSEYQAKAHRYTEQMFGKENVFKAGTIGTVKEKTALGIVKEYAEKKAQEGVIWNKAEIARVAKGLVGVKRTTGQHPGGMVVVPADRSVYEFTALQRPANKVDSPITTTHYDFNSIHDKLVKLDILAHDCPTILKKLKDKTGVDIFNIPLSDAKVMSIFTGVEVLGIKEGELDIDVGTLGIPEFNTSFLRNLLLYVKPKKFADLVSINGLSHGTDIWIGNGMDILESGKAAFGELISTREDIMTRLLKHGLDEELSFKAMESVRKGKGLKDEWIVKMREANVPEWFIESCLKIGYLFPKPHAVAYAIMSYKIAYFKVYHPREFYSVYFTIKADNIDGDLLIRGKTAIKEAIDRASKPSAEVTKNEIDMVPYLETAYEMYCRNIQFLPVDIELSHAFEYEIEEDGIRLPLNCLPGVGPAAAEVIYNERVSEGPYVSIEDIKRRGGASKTVIEALKNHGALSKLPESDQISFFD
ncbi:MAG: PolC-type DNA polymerase III [Clostridiales bacterium]|nr:PolC-type DNA polymerase III [Clostridiales bacterium]